MLVELTVHWLEAQLGRKMVQRMVQLRAPLLVQMMDVQSVLLWESQSAERMAQTTARLMVRRLVVLLAQRRDLKLDVQMELPMALLSAPH